MSLKMKIKTGIKDFSIVYTSTYVKEFIGECDNIKIFEKEN